MLGRVLGRKISVGEIFLFVLLFIFSNFLMWRTFKVDAFGNMVLASRVWSDFAATIPLIRSFSYGSNFPPTYPIFAGPPIRYHFGFFMIVGLLEKVGLGIDWALNLLSIFGFFLLCILIYFAGRAVFKSKGVGFISVILFLFNGSLGFLEFFKKNPISLQTFADIVKNAEFSSFGPYDGKIVSAFWSLNIYTNQRHLALAYAAFILFCLTIFKLSKRPEEFTWVKAMLIGIILGLFPVMHMAVFAMLGIAGGIFFLIYPKIRLKLFVAGLIAIVIAVPQYLYMGFGTSQFDVFSPGYLVEDRTFMGFGTYWIMNLGVGLVLAPAGFIMAKRSQRKFFLPFLALFFVGNLFQFSPEIAANHKFFNLFIIGANFFTALLLIKLWNFNVLGKVIAAPLGLLLILTGLIDLAPILNDRQIILTDYPNSAGVKFIRENTSKDAVFLNASYLYDPASLAGRKIYLGWPYFSWSSGYDTDGRFKTMKAILEGSDKELVCQTLLRERIDYVEINSVDAFEDINSNLIFFEDNFEKVFDDDVEKLKIYNVKATCD